MKLNALKQNKKRRPFLIIGNFHNFLLQIDDLVTWSGNGELQGNDTIPEGPPCKGRKYPTAYWDQTRSEISSLEGKEDDQWFNPSTMDGTYLPNKYDGTCGNNVKFGFIVCAKGQDCDAKFGAYPFIAALGIHSLLYICCSVY